MREIKFRAWDKRQQKWYHKVIEWVFGKPRGSIGQLPELPEGIVLMQYTGLRDKNGKEIYEGDIVNLIPNGYVPIMAEVRITTSGVIYYDTDVEVAGATWGEVKVIGNIYKNPELLQNEV